MKIALFVTKKTKILKNTNIYKRSYYVDGIGQLCLDCYEFHKKNQKT